MKAWDSHTWHNGQPVSGEVRLQPGDHVTLGSVEFSIEADDSLDVAAMLPDLPQASIQVQPEVPVGELPSSPSLARQASSGISDAQPEGWDLDRLRDQIQELRDELSQRVLRRSGAVAIEQTPITSHKQDAEQASARVTELEQSATEARRLTEQAQQDVAELRRELDQLRSETTRREQAWEQQTAMWSTEREQWQEELVSLANARQQLVAEWEQRQSANLDDATRWKTECEQLRAAWQLQQTAWENERSQTRDELRRHEEATQQLLAERELIEAELQQLQAERLERDRAAAALTEERQHVEQQAVEVLAKFEDFSRRMTEFEQQQANFTREQQTLEHSWNWLQSDRRKLVEEKEEWQQQRAHWQAECERWIDESEKLQREREEFAKARDLLHEQQVAAEQLVAQRQQLQDEHSAWAVRREQFETERQIAVDELEAAREELHSQQQAIQDERDRLQALRLELEARSADYEREQQASRTDGPATSNELVTPDEEGSSWASTSRLDVDTDWKNDAASALQPKSSDASPTEMLLSPLTDAWSIGVDLTAPRETYTVDHHVESEITTEWAPSSSIGPVDEVTSPVDLPQHEATSTTQPGNNEDVVATSSSENDLYLIPPPKPDAILDNTVSVPRTEEQAIVPSTGPVVSILESMAFGEDEDVDESVSRYMQHLLARSPNSPAGDRDRYIPVPTEKRSVAAEAKPFSKMSAVNDQTPIETASVSGNHAGDSPSKLENLSQAEVAPSRLHPVHQQDRDAIRAATEQMRQVANQQTVKNVEAANWKQIRRSIKTKLVLAALSFVLSAGLLYWGYYYRPEFMILGIFASVLGVVTWLDLLLAIRQAHVRASKLTGRKKPSGKAKS